MGGEGVSPGRAFPTDLLLCLPLIPSFPLLPQTIKLERSEQAPCAEAPDVRHTARQGALLPSVTRGLPS